MWHQARKQEKAIYSAMVDNKKRAERRRRFYESIKRDPSEFMQVHGRRCKIHMDPAVSKAADSALTFRAWQGDPNVQIDRFDARSHLDVIQEPRPGSPAEDAQDDERWRETRTVAYESYRLLVVNEFEKVGEEKALRRIEVEERFGGVTPASLAKEEREKKKALEGKKAAIAFTYEDSTQPSPATPTPAENDVDEDDEEDEDLELKDVTLDVTEMRPEQSREVNKLSRKYGMIGEDFVRLMWDDRKAADDAAEQKAEDAAKSLLTGRKSRRERALLKQKRLLEAALERPPGQPAILRHHRVWSPDPSKPARESSSSPEPTQAAPGRLTYITSFAADGEQPEKEEKEEGSGVTEGPAPPPPEFKKLIELRKEASPELRAWGEESNHRRRSRSRSRPRRSEDRRRRSRSGERRRRSRSRNRRRRRSPSPDERRHRRRRSNSRDKKDRRRRRSRSRSRKRRRRSTSSSSSSRSPTPAKASFKESNNRRSVSPRPPSASGSVSSASEPELALESGLSDSELERRQVENRKRRVRNAKRKFRRSQAGSRQSSRSGSSEEDVKKVSARQRLAAATARALSRQQRAARLEAATRRKETEREERAREEERRDQAAALRAKDSRRHRDSRSRSPS